MMSEKVIISCPNCNRNIELTKRALYNRRSKGTKNCRKCMYEKIGNKNSQNLKRLWKDEKYRHNMISKIDKSKSIMKLLSLTEEQRKNAHSASASTQRRQENRELSRKMSLSLVTEDFRRKISDAVNKAYCDPVKAAKMKLRKPYTEEMRRSASVKMKELWRTKKFREAWFSGMERISNNHNWISSNQLILYSILDDLGLEYYKEPEDIRKLSFGSYRCDAMILSDRPCIIFVNGDYHHRFIPERVEKDKKFMKFYNEKLAKDYDLLILWEHEFLAKNRIRDRIFEILGKTEEIRHIDKESINFCVINRKEGDEFLSKYHYMTKGGRGGTYFGIYHRTILIGVSSFSSITRKESADRLGAEPHQVLELNKFCLNPGYYSHNLSSWFLSRCVKFIKKNRTYVKYLLAFSDEAFQHLGTIYKASGWMEDGCNKPSYWYVDSNGHIIHKKTLYVHARSIRMKESDFAVKFGYRKIYTGRRIRFVKELYG